MRRMESVVHARGQPERDIETVAVTLDQLLGSEQVGQAVGKSFDLKKFGSGDPPVSADDGIAGTHHDTGIRVDPPRIGLQFAGEAVVDALECGLRASLKS